MQSLHRTKKTKKIFIIVIVVALLIFLNPFSIFDNIRNVIVKPFVSIGALGKNSGILTSESLNAVLHIGTLYKENQRLQSEVAQLKTKNILLEDVINENEMLRKELSLLPRDEFELVGAEVIIRDALGGNHWVIVNKGSVDGIKEQQPVIVEDGIFVGYIDKVDNNSSRVRLLTHPDSIVNVATARTGAEAIAYGKYGLSVVAQDIKKDDDIVNGDVFITSQIGNIFPRGLSVGVVQNIEQSKNELFKNAIIIPFASLDDLRFVSIIINKK